MRRILFALLFGMCLTTAHASRLHRPVLHWTKCVLRYGPRGGFQSKTCRHYAMPHVHGRVVGVSWREVLKSRTERVRVTYPVVQPVYALPGCPPAIAQWAPYVIEASRSTGVPVRAITGIINIESGGNPNAYNPSSGASGLGQFLPSTAASLGVNPWIPASAIPGIARYYRMVGATAYSGGGYGDGLIYARGCD